MKKTNTIRYDKLDEILQSVQNSIFEMIDNTCEEAKHEADLDSFTSQLIAMKDKALVMRVIGLIRIKLVKGE